MGSIDTDREQFFSALLMEIQTPKFHEDRATVLLDSPRTSGTLHVPQHATVSVTTDPPDNPCANLPKSLLVSWHMGKFAKRGYQFDLSDEDIKAHFSVLGEIEGVEPFNDVDGFGRCRIHFAESCSLDAALTKSKHTVEREYGKMIKVQTSVEQCFSNEVI